MGTLAVDTAQKKERETLQRMAQQSQSSEQSAREVNDVGLVARGGTTDNNLLEKTS